MPVHRRSPMKSNDETSNMPLVLVYVAALIHFLSPPSRFYGVFIRSLVI